MASLRTVRGVLRPPLPWCASSTPPVVCFVHPSRGVLRPPSPWCASSTPPVVCFVHPYLGCASSTQTSSCASMPRNPKVLKPLNQSLFILTSIVPLLQQRGLSKASCRRQRIMARAQRFLDPPQMLRPGDACHRCPLMGQAQEPFSNVAIFLVACFGCCER
jgi:hypothetical protein